MSKVPRSSKSKASRTTRSLRLSREVVTGRIVTKVMEPKAFSPSGKLVRTLVKRPRQTDKVELRVAPDAKARLQAAAAASRQTLSGFLLDSGLERADNVLADRTLFLLDDKTWKAFVAALEAPTRPKPRLKRLLTEPSIVD
jgi:uncharacterized protein (DUF1778 family)